MNNLCSLFITGNINMIHHKTGDLFKEIQPFIDAKKKIIIPHVCNNLGLWGAGFVLAINKHDPGQKAMYVKEMEKHKKNAYKALGITLLCPSTIGPNVFFAHMIAQTGIRSNLNPHPLSYDALQSCLLALHEKISKWKNTVILAPKFGSGLSGGYWPTIENILETTIENKDIYIYTL
jgi:hypothetical protein